MRLMLAACQLTYRPDSTTRPRLTNQHARLQHINSFRHCFIRQVRIISFVSLNLFHVADSPSTHAYILSVILYFCIKNLVAYREEEEEEDHPFSELSLTQKGPGCSCMTEREKRSDIRESFQHVGTATSLSDFPSLCHSLSGRRPA